MDQKTRDVLIAARAIIADPAMWYQGGWSASGAKYNLSEPCCAECAIFRADADHNGVVVSAYRAISAMQVFTPHHRRIDIFNDAPTTTHADIMAVFDRAIAGEQAA